MTMTADPFPFWLWVSLVERRRRGGGCTSITQPNPIGA